MREKLSQYKNFIRENISKLNQKKVIIVGDVGLDEYIFGNVKRISPEAPVPIVEVETQEFRLGLAANVAQNISSLGGTPILISVVGADKAAQDLKTLLEKSNVSAQNLVLAQDRPTTHKARVMVQNHHIVRVDYERKQFLDSNTENAIINLFQTHIDSAVAVIIQDYAKGVLSKELIQKLVQIAHQKNKKVLADPNRSTPLDYYRGVDLMTPNLDESIALTQMTTDQLRPDEKLIEKMGFKLMKDLESPQMVITRGKDGMSLFENLSITEMPTFARQVSDVTGAGDTVIAAMALAWGSGFNLEQSCAISNFAAGYVVGKIGCVSCSQQNLLDYLEQTN